MPCGMRASICLAGGVGVNGSRDMGSSTGTFPGGPEALEGFSAVEHPSPQAHSREVARRFVTAHRRWRDAEPGRRPLGREMRGFGCWWRGGECWLRHGRPDGELELLELPDDLHGLEPVEAVGEGAELGG